MPHNGFSTFPIFSVFKTILLIQFNFIRYYFFKISDNMEAFSSSEYVGNLTF